MAVLVEAYCLIILREAIARRAAEGFDAFLKTVPGGAVCYDDDLLCIGFMDSRDAWAYATVLQQKGFVFAPENPASDFTTVQQTVGPQFRTDWLTFAHSTISDMTLSIAWRTGTEPRTICMPGHWKYEGSLSQNPNHAPPGAVGDRYKYLRTENGVEAYLDLQTNREVYLARPVIAGDTEAALQTQLQAIGREALQIEGKGDIVRPRFLRGGSANFKRLNNELLPEVNRIVAGPGKELALAHFIRAIVLRPLGQREEAVAALLKAHKLKPDWIGPLRDLVRALAELKRPQEALPFARRAVEIDSADAAAQGNLAACLMQCGQLDEAAIVVDRALAIDEKDAINLRIRDTIRRRKGK